MYIIHVVGARPNFMKAAPVIRALAQKSNVDQLLVHTGQHYDHNMSQIFFKELELPEPDLNLEVGSSSHAVQTAEIIKGFEQVVLSEKPDWVMVYGDVNSTVAAALVCAKLGVPIAHVEAGLRSFDRAMPEEINRLVTDQIADLLFTPSIDGNENLVREGIDERKIHLVGNVMIDTLVRLLAKTKERWPTLREKYSLRNFGLVTLHRPSNVDDPDTLIAMMDALKLISCDLPLIFPVHPRTRNRLSELGWVQPENDFLLVEPLGYLDFLSLQSNAKLVITDSGGIQEESTYLGIPCVTVRKNTERPVTISVGTNTLVGQDMELLRSEAARIIAGGAVTNSIPELWDGKTGERIADVLLSGS